MLSYYKTLYEINIIREIIIIVIIIYHILKVPFIHLSNKVLVIRSPHIHIHICLSNHILSMPHLVLSRTAFNLIAKGSN